MCAKPAKDSSVDVNIDELLMAGTHGCLSMFTSSLLSAMVAAHAIGCMQIIFDCFVDNHSSPVSLMHACVCVCVCIRLSTVRTAETIRIQWCVHARMCKDIDNCKPSSAC